MSNDNILIPVAGNEHIYEGFLKVAMEIHERSALHAQPQELSLKAKRKTATKIASEASPGTSTEVA